MRTLVAYFSQTGRSKKVAEAIFQALEGEKEIKELSEVDSLEGYDLSFIGFPIIAFGPAREGKEFLEKHAAGKKVALFVTHASPEEEAGVEDWLDRCREAASSAALLGLFHCQGELAQPVAEALMKSDDPVLRAYGERRPQTVGQPDESRLQKAREFAREVYARARSG